MQYSDLEIRSAIAGQLDAVAQLETSARVRKELKKMEDSGEALVLSSEEDSMLRQFRRFKLRMRKNGEVFTWQTRKPEGIEIVQDSALILHPSEA